MLCHLEKLPERTEFIWGAEEKDPRAQGTRESQSAPTMIKPEVGNSLPGIKNVFKILFHI